MPRNQDFMDCFSVHFASITCSSWRMRSTDMRSCFQRIQILVFLLFAVTEKSPALLQIQRFMQSSLLILHFTSTRLRINGLWVCTISLKTCFAGLLSAHTFQRQIFSIESVFLHPCSGLCALSGLDAHFPSCFGLLLDLDHCAFAYFWSFYYPSQQREAGRGKC